MYNLFQILKDVDSNLHSGGVSGLQDFYSIFDKARREILREIRPVELIRKSYLEQALYPNIDRYSVPEDLKYSDIIELKLLSHYANVDTMNNPARVIGVRRFGQKRPGETNAINISYENGVKYAHIENPLGIERGPAIIQGQNNDVAIEGISFLDIVSFDDLASNGVWNGGGNVTNLRHDALNVVNGQGSLQFDIDNTGTTGFLENTSLDSFDLSDFLKRGALFSWLNIPIAQEFLTVTIKFGSNLNDLSTDFYTASVNAPHDNNAFVNGWNLVRFMLPNIAQVGTPNPNDLQWIRIEFTTTSQAIPNCNIDNLTARKGKVYEIKYNSRYCVIDPQTKAFKKIPTSLNDLVVAEDDFYNLLVIATTKHAQYELYGSSQGAKSDIVNLEASLQKAIEEYKMQYPSEALVSQDSYQVYGNIYDGYSDDTLPGWNTRI